MAAKKTAKKTTAEHAPKATKGSNGAANPIADPALKKRYGAALARFQNAQSKESQDWDDQYEALGDILYSNPPLYLAGGYKTARAFLTEHLPGVDEHTARRNIDVAKYFDPEDETKHTITKLSLLLGYLQATGKLPIEPIKIHPDRIKVEVGNGKAKQSKRLADISSPELKALVARLRNRNKGVVHTDSPAEKVVRGVFHDAGIDDVTISVRNDRMHLGNILIADLPAVGRALAKAKV